MSASQTAGAAPILEAIGLAKHYRVRTKRFGRPSLVRAAEDISLALHPGRVTAVVGESGSGKSTVSRLLARTTAPTAGELRLGGTAMNTRGSVGRDYRAAVQMVLQDPFASLNPVHDVRYILGRPLKIHGYGGDDIDASIRDLLHRVALEPADQFIDKYPHELSGGQRQRVAIARALAVRPQVLLADEPVSMLDVSIRLGVLNLLADLRDREGLAILYVTHDIASARYLADTIVVMYAGRIVESGPAEQVTDEPSHPYTQLLLSAAPDPDAGQPTRLGQRGAPPSLVTPPAGCRFHPRCPFVMDVCRTDAPPMFTASDGHESACWLLADTLLAAADGPSVTSPSAAGPSQPAVERESPMA